MEYIGKDIYFYNVYLFIDRAKQFIITKGTNLVRKNLQLNLRSTALLQQTSKLSNTKCRIASYSKDLKKQSKLLIKRFKQPFFITIELLLKESYTLRDTVAKRKPRDFA